MDGRSSEVDRSGDASILGEAFAGTVLVGARSDIEAVALAGENEEIVAVRIDVAGAAQAVRCAYHILAFGWQSGLRVLLFVQSHRCLTVTTAH